MLDKAIQQQTDELIGVIQNFMQQVDERFNKLERSLDRLTNTIDGFVKRLEDAEIEQRSRDRQFERLLAWARIKFRKKPAYP